MKRRSVFFASALALLLTGACGGQTTDGTGSTTMAAGGSSAAGAGGSSTGKGGSSGASSGGTGSGAFAGSSACGALPPDCVDCNGSPYPPTCTSGGWQCSILDCPPPLPKCTAPNDCGNAMFCNAGLGHCPSSSQPGLCTSKPQGCDTIGDPHCGCFTGKLYGNECEANTAGEPAYPCNGGVGGSSGGSGGAAGAGGSTTAKMCGGSQGIPCGASEYCDFGPLQCPAPGSVGTCVTKPGACPLPDMAVCGCFTGTIYSSACFAAAAGEPSSYCPGGTGGAGGGPQAQCGGFAGTACPPGSFCDFPDKMCGGNDGSGVCLPAPDLCPTGDPVCGCDGKVYTSACMAAASGVDVSLLTTCMTPSGAFPCGWLFCKLGLDYCQVYLSDTGGPNDYSCQQLPLACGDGGGDCACLAGVTCGGDCKGTTSSGLSVFCPGG